MKNNSFLLKQVHGGTVVKIATMDEYDAFLKRCTERKVPFFTHQVDAKKPTRIVLLGLPNMPVNEIQEVLAERGIIPDDIKPMNIRSKKLLEHNNYILYFAKGTMTTCKLRDIKAINNVIVIVRWAYYDAKRHGPTQCRRCQEWGHGSSHCQVAPACVRCAGQHETAECNLAAKGIKLPKEQLKCVNCKLQHTANYGGCKVHKDYIKNQPKRQQRQQNQSYRPQYNNVNRWPGLQGQQPVLQRQQCVQQQGPPRQQWPKQGSPPNYQQHRSNVTSKNTNTTNITNPIVGSADSEGLFSVEELFQIMTDLIPIAQNCKSRQEQMQKMLQLVPKYFPPCNGGP
jgi:hypothetical protein